MARATSTFQSQDNPPATGEWQELRGELVALLDQVETQVAKTAGEPGYQDLADRMRDLRHQVTESGDTRHREALRSVQRAIDKFSDRDAPLAAPTNPRDTLEDAIRQIRSRHFPAKQAVPAPAAAAPRYDELALSVEGFATRLERLEAELRSQAKGQTANVHEIAEQMGQLSHVVELLAGAVGETGQVKRLETHIASLATLIADSPKVDMEALTQRLDDVAMTVGKLGELQLNYAERTDLSGMTARLDDFSATVGRLADLQVQFANKVEKPREDGLKDAVKAIEDGVRNIYDRLDAVERTMAVPPAELENITAELGRIAQLVKAPSAPQGLIELIDALNERISDIETRSTEVGALKLDMEAFRATVTGAMEPRFEALETRIDALGDKIAAKPSIEPNISQLEAQVRQLVARMDQTGEQLTGLAKLYGTPAPLPDMKALADMVAARTSAEIGKHVAAAAMPPAMVEADYAEIEKRIGRLIEASSTQEPAPETEALEATIREVNERLQRLETALVKPAADARAAIADVPAPAKKPAASKAAVVETKPEPAPELATVIAEDRTATAELDVPAPPKAKPVAAADLMPAPPSAEAPLVDIPFGDPDPVQLALESMRERNARNTPAAGFDDTLPSLEMLDREPQPAFDPSRAERPPQPKSTLDLPDNEVFVASPAADEVTDIAPPEGEAAPNRNAFIEAHRRSVRQAGPRNAMPADASSLIGRAFARFQANQGESVPAEASAKPIKAKPTKAEKPAKAEKPVKAAKLAKPAKAERPAKTDEKKGGPFGLFKGKPARQLAGDKDPPKAWTPDDAGAIAASAAASLADVTPEAPETKTPKAQGGSFLVRHRQPILLAASVVALACLTLNLINQRMQPGEDPAAAQRATDVGDAALTPVPMAQQGLTLPTGAGPRVALDALTTASIDGGAQKFAPTPTTTALPTAFTAATNLATAADDLSTTVEPLALESPVSVERPPVEVGPEPLLAAAGDGDARAQFEVAAIYTEGRAVPEDLQAAAMWYERAANQGLVPAQYRLGNLYENGRGVDRDLAQARLWYQRAAEAGNRMAMHNLAALYAGGKLGKQDFEAAAKWFEEAANRGMKDSQFNLGMLYARGLGVKQDLSASYKWFSLAANRGDADAAKARDDIAGSLDAATVQALIDDVAAFKPQPIEYAANFAPIGTWSKSFDPGEAITNTKVVIGVQKALEQLGFDVGTPDGVAGAKTSEAIRGFERATGMSEVGQINPRLLAVLGSQPV